MTTGQLITLVLGSAALGAIVAAVINGFVMQKLKQAEIKEGRMRMAAELTRLKSEQAAAVAADYIEGAKLLQAAGQAVQPRPEIAHMDPAVMLSDYVEALDEIARTGRWQKGDQGFAKYREALRKARQGKGTA